MLHVRNVSTTVSEAIIITNLTGRINTADVEEWFNDFEKTCQAFIDENRKYKLLVNRKGYTPDHFSVQKLWRDKFFNETLLKSCIAMAFLMEEGEILKDLQSSNVKKTVEFFSDYAEAWSWLNPEAT